MVRNCLGKWNESSVNYTGCKLSSHSVLVCKGTLEDISLTPFIVEISKQAQRHSMIVYLNKAGTWTQASDTIRDQRPFYNPTLPSMQIGNNWLWHCPWCAGWAQSSFPICFLSPSKHFQRSLIQQFTCFGEFDPAVTKRWEILHPPTC